MHRVPPRGRLTVCESGPNGLKLLANNVASELGLVLVANPDFTEIRVSSSGCIVGTSGFHRSGELDEDSRRRRSCRIPNQHRGRKPIFPRPEAVRPVILARPIPQRILKRLFHGPDSNAGGEQL